MAALPYQVGMPLGFGSHSGRVLFDWDDGDMGSLLGAEECKLCNLLNQLSWESSQLCKQV